MAIAAAAITAGCVPPYNSQPAVFSETEVHTSLSTRYDYGSNDHSISDNWRRVNAVCDLVRSRMERENDSIETRNALIGAGFAALAAGLASASGIYSLWKGSDADSRVTATLGLGAGASTVPTFFYFGSDQRSVILKQRMQSLDDARQQVLQKYAVLEAADRSWDQAERQNPQDPTELARARSDRQKAQDALNDALLQLAQRCE